MSERVRVIVRVRVRVSDKLAKVDSNMYIAFFATIKRVSTILKVNRKVISRVTFCKSAETMLLLVSSRVVR